MVPPRQYTVRELDSILRSPKDIFILDVRQPWEVDVAPLRGAVNIPLEDLPERLHELPDQSDPFVVLCHHGVRSLKVSLWLQQQGYRAINLKGGIDAWSEEIDPTIPKY